MCNNNNKPSIVNRDADDEKSCRVFTFRYFVVFFFVAFRWMFSVWSQPGNGPGRWTGWELRLLSLHHIFIIHCEIATNFTSFVCLVRIVFVCFFFFFLLKQMAVHSSCFAHNGWMRFFFCTQLRRVRVWPLVHHWMRNSIRMECDNWQNLLAFSTSVGFYLHRCIDFILRIWMPRWRSLHNVWTLKIINIILAAKKTEQIKKKNGVRCACVCFVWIVLCFA